jgi:hypothetical protein
VRAEFEQVPFEPVAVSAALEHAVGDEVRGISQADQVPSVVPEPTRVPM